MSIDRRSSSPLDCPQCEGNLQTWVKARLQVEFCSDCSALFLDRGELFTMFRAEGYNCPPEALLRIAFAPTEAGALECPKCRDTTLRPGTVQGVDIWHCTPCNGFLVDRSLVLGHDDDHGAAPRRQGFERVEGRPYPSSA